MNFLLKLFNTNRTRCYTKVEGIISRKIKSAKGRQPPLGNDKKINILQVAFKKTENIPTRTQGKKVILGQRRVQERID